MKFLISLFLIPAILFSQKVHYKLEYSEATIQLSEDVFIGSVANGFIAVVPEAPNGAIVFFQAKGKVDTNERIVRIANQLDLAVLYLTTNNKLEFLFTEENQTELAEYLKTAVAEYDIPSDNLLFCGMSLAGTRAMIMSKFFAEHTLYQKLQPKAVAICDAPLDFVRFYQSGVKAFSRNIHDLAAQEGLWTSQYLKSNLGGTPSSHMTEYLNYSPISHLDTDSNKLNFLKDTHVRVYTEPDIHWWMTKRGKDYYGMNSVDAALLVNELNWIGSTRASLITTMNKGVKPDGSIHPHSWSIVDEFELIHWFAHL